MKVSKDRVTIWDNVESRTLPCCPPINDPLSSTREVTIIVNGQFCFLLGLPILQLLLLFLHALHPVSRIHILIFTCRPGLDSKIWECPGQSGTYFHLIQLYSMQLEQEQRTGCSSWGGQLGKVGKQTKAYGKKKERRVYNC